MVSEQVQRKTIIIVVTAEETARLFVSGFAGYLATEGHRVVIVADRLDSVASPAAGIELAPIAMKRNPSPVADVLSLFRLTQLIRRVKPDIIMYATPKASLLGAIGGTLARVRTRIYQLWGLRLETVRGVGRVVLSAMERLTSRLSTGILANSASLGRRYTELQLNAGKRVDVLGMGSSHGVDLRRFAADADVPAPDEDLRTFLTPNEGHLVVGFIGRLHPDKGVDTLLRATEIARAEGNKIRLLVVGPNEGVNPVEPTHDTLFVGRQRDPRPYLRCMDVLCLPSLREGFPNVVLEAAAMGIPSIVSDATGAIDSVIPGVTGLVSPVGNAEALAHALTELAQNHELVRTMGVNAHDWVKEFFQQEDVWRAHAEYMFTTAQANPSQP